MMKHSLAAFAIFFSITATSQTSAIYDGLPTGKYGVGFMIINLTDDTRMAKPEYNYLGEKNEGDRRMKMTIHVWYPAKTQPTKKKLTFGDYCYNHLQQSTSEKIDKALMEGQIANRRRAAEGWFGKTTDEAWQKLLSTSLLAEPDAEPLSEKFPLLVGTLRTLSTSVTNELLASNGYVVAMVLNPNVFGNALGEAESIADMRLTMSNMAKYWPVDMDKIGTFGFSGSGFSQVLMAMNEYRVKAVADLESGLYMEGLFQNFSRSNYYQPAKMRVPFLHIFSADLSKEEKFLDEFTNKTKFATRYRLLLNQPGLHHWDFACEGYTAAIFLNNRGEKSENIRRTFEISHYYLLQFFNAFLKKEEKAQAFLEKRPVIKNTADSLWSIQILPAGKPAPSGEEFEYIIRKKGIENAIGIVRNTIKEDPQTNLLQWFILNRMGYTFLGEKKYKEAIEIFKLNTELHPGDPNLFDSLAEGYETAGDTENMKKVSASAIELLNKKETLNDQEKALKQNAERRLK